MNKDINKTLSMLVPVLNQTGERIESIEAVRNWYKAEDYEGVTREYMKEVAEITFENGARKYADIGSDSNLAAIYDCKYWCDVPELPDMGDNQFDMRGEKDE